MHLTWGMNRHKGKEYKSYSIAESYRDGKAVRKHILFPLGKLTETQVEQIKEKCRDGCLLQLPADALKEGTIFDGYDNELYYDEDGGFGSKLVVISPGPDGEIDTHEDNIRSDR